MAKPLQRLFLVCLSLRCGSIAASVTRGIAHSAVWLRRSTHKYFLSKIDQQQTAIFVSQRRKLRPKGSHNVFLRGEEDPSWTLGCDEEEEARGCEHFELQVRFLDD
jgi:hypothetical protein